MPESTDAVGYRRPPHNTRFRPGRSGNPAGRPKKLPTMRAVLVEELGKTVRVKEDGKEVRTSQQAAMVKALVAMAVDGDVRAAKLVIEMCERDVEEPAEALNNDDAEILEEFMAAGQRGQIVAAKTKSDQ